MTHVIKTQTPGIYPDFTVAYDAIDMCFPGIIKREVTPCGTYVYTKNIVVKATELEKIRKRLGAKDIEVLVPHDNTVCSLIYLIVK